jgi:TPR repeat protein
MGSVERYGRREHKVKIQRSLNVDGNKIKKIRLSEGVQSRKSTISNMKNILVEFLDACTQTEQNGKKQDAKIKWHSGRAALTGFHWEQTDVHKGMDLAIGCHYEPAKLFILATYFPYGLSGRQNCSLEAYETFLKSSWTIKIWSLYDVEPDDLSLFEHYFVFTKAFKCEFTLEEATALHKRVLVAQDPTVMCVLARWYLEFPKDVAKAVSLFEKAATAGDRVAQYYFGTYCFDRDDPMRYFWWTKALGRKNSSANYPPPSRLSAP